MTEFRETALVLAHCRLSDSLLARFAQVGGFCARILAGAFLDELLDLVLVRGEVLHRSVEQRIERALAFGLAL